jgi:hypothetical protein
LRPSPQVLAQALTRVQALALTRVQALALTRVQALATLVISSSLKTTKNSYSLSHGWHSIRHKPYEINPMKLARYCLLMSCVCGQVDFVFATDSSQSPHTGIQETTEAVPTIGLERRLSASPVENQQEEQEIDDPAPPVGLERYEPIAHISKNIRAKAKMGMLRQGYEDQFIGRISTWSPWAGAGLEIQFGDFSLVSNYTVTNQSTTENLFPVSTTTVVNTATTITNTAHEDRSISRDDYDINLAWNYKINPLHAVSVFAGYKWASTSINRQRFNIVEVVNGENRTTTPIVTYIPIEFKTDGPFIGFSYEYKPNPESELRMGFNAAYGLLNGQYISGSNIVDPQNTNAFRYGLYLTSPFKGGYENISYTFSIDAYKYSLEPSKVEQQSREFSTFVREDMYTIGLSFSYKFDF